MVSARRYRPSIFENVIGQNHITDTLVNAIKTNHLAQAFLFCGPRGVGKTTCARILAQTVNCDKTHNGNPCHQCESCLSFKKGRSLNIIELDAASNNSVEDIRNLIEQVRYAPQGMKEHQTKKIYIIDEVHMLSNAAFNAFLKTLEEPPKYVIFILATTEKHKVLPTILSRCQVFYFKNIHNRDIVKQLDIISKQENIETEEAALHLIAQKANGGMRDALSIFDMMVTHAHGHKITYQIVMKNLHVLDHDYYFNIADVLYQSNFANALLLLDEIITKGFDIHQFLLGLSEHLRNLLVCKTTQTHILLDTSELIQNRYIDQGTELSKSFLVTAIAILNEALIHFKTIHNQRLHTEINLIKIAHINHVLNLEIKKESLNLPSSPSKISPSRPSIQHAKLIDPLEKLKILKADIKDSLISSILNLPSKLEGKTLTFELISATQKDIFLKVKPQIETHLGLDININYLIKSTPTDRQQDDIQRLKTKSEAFAILYDGLDLLPL